MNSFLLRVANPILARKVPPTFGAKAIDIGCGSGANAYLLKKRGYAVEALDIDPDAAKVGKKHGIKVSIMSMLDFNWKTKYDCILLLYVLQHVEKKEALNLLKKAFNSMFPNAFMYVAIFNNEPGKIDYLTIEQEYRSRTDLYLYFRQTWTMLDKQHGIPHVHMCDYFIFRKL